jgi:hypothetical protein
MKACYLRERSNPDLVEKEAEPAAAASHHTDRTSRHSFRLFFVQEFPDITGTPVRQFLQVCFSFGKYLFQINVRSPFIKDILIMQYQT